MPNPVRDTYRAADVGLYLRQVRGLISRMEHWQAGGLASMGDGTPCWPGDPRAVRWCLVGAILRVCGPKEALAFALLARLAPKATRPLMALAQWSDRTTHAVVLARVDAVLRELGEQDDTSD